MQSKKILFNDIFDSENKLSKTKVHTVLIFTIYFFVKYDIIAILRTTAFHIACDSKINEWSRAQHVSRISKCSTNDQNNLRL